MSGYDFLKSQVLSWWQNIGSDSDVVMSSGKVFQTRGPATVKARLPTVDSLACGTSRLLVPADQAQCPTTGQIGNRNEWTQVPRRTSVKNFVSERQLCTQSALGRAEWSVDWQARRWCGLRISCGRWAVPPHSVLTEDDVPDKPEDRSVRHFRSPVWTAPRWPPKTGTWLAVLSGGSNVIVGVLQSNATRFF